MAEGSFLNRFMRLRAARLSAMREEREPESPSTNSVDRWSTRAASWAQIGTLLLLGLGYFLTVRPVFQYQLLQEQNAKLELQNSAAQATLRDTLAKQAAAAHELMSLTTALERTNREREALEKALRSERDREEKAQQAATASEGKIAAQVAALDEAKKRLLITAVFTFQMAAQADADAQIRHSAWVSYSEQYQKDFDGHFISDAKATWHDPYKEITGSIDALTSHAVGADAYPDKAVEMLRSRLEKARTVYACPTVDFDEMKSDFLSEIAGVEPLVTQDVAAEVDRMKRSETNPFLRLVIDKTTLETITTNARLARRGQIVSAYWGRLLKLHESCQVAANGFLLAVIGTEAPK